jgi:hypothetical protein
MAAAAARRCLDFARKELQLLLLIVAWHARETEWQLLPSFLGSPCCSLAPLNPDSSFALASFVPGTS